MAKVELDIDPKNLKFDFEGEWSRFKTTRVSKFLSLWLQKRLEDLRCKLENISEQELGSVQGAIKEVRALISLVERPFAVDALKEVLTFIESK